MRKLYLQIYFSFVAVVLLFAVLASGVFFVLRSEFADREKLSSTAARAGSELPAPDRSSADLQASVERLARISNARISVRASDGTLLAAAGWPLPPPPPGFQGNEIFPSPRGEPTMALRLADGRWVLVGHRAPNRANRWLTIIGLLALAIAAGAYPIARRITRRLERLRSQVEAFGAGQLAARVPVEGNDEVADLAASFNQAAGRIERLVREHRTLLANVSHELRTPLTRLRMALELMEKERRPDLKAQVERNISELDDLIGELLLASRLNATDRLENTEDVDLLALLAEEAARCGAELSGEPVTVRGDPRLLRRLTRNLLENAACYAPGVPPEVSIRPDPAGGAVLRVTDRGPGVPDGERERIFEPFFRLPGSIQRNETGAGLGLALVRRIARCHGGDARCLPRNGGGSIFEVKLGGTAG